MAGGGGGGSSDTPSARGSTAAAPAEPSACAQPTGLSGVQPTRWLSPGIEISVPISASESPAVTATSGFRESSSV